MKVYICINALDIEREIEAIFLDEKHAQQFKNDTDYSGCRIEIEPYEVIV